MRDATCYSAIPSPVQCSANRGWPDERPFKGRPLETSGRREGFTLIEVLTSFVVLSVATYIVVAIFTASVDLRAKNKLQMVASMAAEEQLADIVQHPTAYQWPELTAGEFKEILPSDTQASAPDTTHPVTHPTTMPLSRRAYQREQALYERLGWRAYVKLPEAEATYVEVTVEAQWKRDGRPESFALTSLMPRSAVEGQA